MMLRAMDIWLFQVVNAFHAPWWDALMLFGSDLGRYHGWMVAMPAVAVLAAWQLQRNPPQWRLALAPYGIALLCLAIGYWAAIPLVEMLKDVFHTPRPYAVLPADQVVHLGTHLTPGSEMRSFPSGHAAVAATLALSFGVLPHAWLRRCALALAVWIAVSRMACGVHFPSDVLGGAAIATALILPARWSLTRWHIRSVLRG